MSGPFNNAPDAIGGSRYRFVCSLGRGGMAEVQLALQTSSTGVERLAVLKRVRSELAEQPAFAAMFVEEARIAATLSHQNVVQTYEVGHDSDGYFIVLEYLQGQPYGSILSKAGYANYRFSLEVLLGTLLGLEYAHQLKHLSGREMGLVHRDVSPPNIFVTYDGQVKVLDFGIAKALDSTVQTQTGVIKGKVSYMSPEQMHGGALDLRADLYAVGVMLWEATAGCRRFPGMPDVAVVSAVSTHRAPITPGAAERGLPALADTICARALALDPNDRYSSAAQFYEDLSALADLAGGRVPPRALGQYVSELFAAQREQLQRQIEAELEHPRTGRTTPFGSGTEREDSPDVTRVLPEPRGGEARSLGSRTQPGPLTAPGVQTDASLTQSSGTAWKLAAGLAVAALLGLVFAATTKLLPTSKGTVAAVASHPSLVSSVDEEAAAPGAVILPETLALPVASAPTARQMPASRTMPVPSTKHTLAKPKAVVDQKQLSKPASTPVQGTSKESLDRSNPWGT